MLKFIPSRKQYLTITTLNLKYLERSWVDAMAPKAQVEEAASVSIERKEAREDVSRTAGVIGYLTRS
jgi:hypothetical protein